jgi:hypothetical protein
MKLPIILGIAFGFILYELGFVIPWIISNSTLPVQIDIALFVGNALSVMYVVYKLYEFYEKNYAKKKKRKPKVHGEAEYINKLKADK